MEWTLDQTLMETLGIEMVQLEKDIVVMTMPVDNRTHQPAGYLHGGASVALAETAASFGAFVNVDSDHFTVFGMEINANHIRSKREGTVTATATPLHKGRTTMVWDVKITDEANKLICVSRCTVGVVPKRPEK